MVIIMRIPGGVQLLVPLILATLLTACGDDEVSGPDVGLSDAGEVADVVADTTVDDAIDDAEDDAGPGTECGSELVCDPGQVCLIECICCGIDTGNPDDAQTDYRCITPDPSCTESPAECVGAELGCFPQGEALCSSPCA